MKRKALPVDFPTDLLLWSDTQTIKNEVGSRVLYALIDENRGILSHRELCINSRFVEVSFRNQTFKSEWTYHPKDQLPVFSERWSTIKY